MPAFRCLSALAVASIGLGAIFASDPPPSVAAGNTAFALDLYGKLRGRDGNLFVSPFSISAALAMTQAGAHGETLAEMEKVLHLGGGAATHAAFGELIKELTASARKSEYQLAIANALWGQQGFPFKQDFLDLTKRYYGAGLRQVDFRQPDQARKTINRWVEEQTRDKIKDLLQPGNVTPMTRLVLTNAVYFKDSWVHPFNKAATQDETFYAPGQEMKAPLMKQRERFPYYEGDGLQAVELPYRGRLSMVVVLPTKRDGLAELEGRLSAEKLGTWTKGMRPREGDVALPRFKINDRIELAPVLESMGMRQAFGGKADFSGMTTSEKLFIDQVIHQTFVAVDEQGTEAAAATAVGMRAMAAPIPTEPFKFRADHPFVFLIRDPQSGTVLFMGRVEKPLV